MVNDANNYSHTVNQYVALFPETHSPPLWSTSPAPVKKLFCDYFLINWSKPPALPEGAEFFKGRTPEGLPEFLLSHDKRGEFLMGGWHLSIGSSEFKTSTACTPGSYKRSKTSNGRLIRTCAPFSRNSLAERKPQRAPTGNMPAATAVFMSTALSPR